MINLKPRFSFGRQIGLRAVNNALLAAALCAASGSPFAQAGAVPTPQPAQPSAQASVDFVQKFLAWYVPLANSQNQSKPVSWAVLGNGNGWVSSGLAEILRADSSARVASNSVRETFNADPFLDSQDPCKDYQAVSASPQGNRFIVKVAPKCGAGNWGKRDTISYVIQWSANKPQIADVNYVAKERSLIGWLCLYESKDTKATTKSRVCSEPARSN